MDRVLRLSLTLSETANLASNVAVLLCASGRNEWAFLSLRIPPSIWYRQFLDFSYSERVYSMSLSFSFRIPSWSITLNIFSYTYLTLYIFFVFYSDLSPIFKIDLFFFIAEF